MQWSLFELAAPFSANIFACHASLSPAKPETAQWNGWPLKTHAPLTIDENAIWNWCAKSAASPNPTATTDAGSTLSTESLVEPPTRARKAVIRRAAMVGTFRKSVTLDTAPYTWRTAHRLNYTGAHWTPTLRAQSSSRSSRQVSRPEGAARSSFSGFQLYMYVCRFAHMPRRRWPARGASSWRRSGSSRRCTVAVHVPTPFCRCRKYRNSTFHNHVSMWVSTTATQESLSRLTSRLLLFLLLSCRCGFRSGSGCFTHAAAPRVTNRTPQSH